jgi:hypothetical protein
VKTAVRPEYGLATFPSAMARIAVLRNGRSVQRKNADAHAYAQYAIFERRKELRRLRMDRLYDEAAEQ